MLWTVFHKHTTTTRGNVVYANPLFVEDNKVLKKTTKQTTTTTTKSQKKNNINNIPGTGLSGFRIFCQRNLDSGFQLLVGFPIPRVVFRIPKARIPDSTNKILKDFGIWIPSQVSKGVTYMYVSFSNASLLAAWETSICKFSGRLLTFLSIDNSLSTFLGWFLPKEKAIRWALG